MIDLLRSKQVKMMGNRKETILIDKEQDVNPQIEGKTLEVAQQDQSTLEVGKQ